MKKYPTTQANKATLAVSQCLLGDRVRYDAACIPHLVVIQTLASQFNLLAICPEMEAGLGVPRPAVQLSGTIHQPRMTGRDIPELDITERIVDFTQHRVLSLDQIDGFVFKSRSPSCGLNSTPVYQGGICLTESSRGLFARGVCQRYPDLPVIEDSELDSASALQAFIDAVMTRTSVPG